MPKTKSKAPELEARRDPTPPIEDAATRLLTLLSDVGSSDEVKKLCFLQDENASLHQQLSNSQTAYTENLQQLLIKDQTLGQERVKHAAELQSERNLRAGETADLMAANDQLTAERQALREERDKNAEISNRIQGLINETKSKDTLITKLEAENAAYKIAKENLVQENDQLKESNEYE